MVVRNALTTTFVTTTTTASSFTPIYCEGYEHAYLREVGGKHQVHIALVEVDLAGSVQTKHVCDEGYCGAHGADDDIPVHRQSCPMSIPWAAAGLALGCKWDKYQHTSEGAAAQWTWASGV